MCHNVSYLPSLLFLACLFSPFTSSFVASSPVFLGVGRVITDFVKLFILFFFFKHQCCFVALLVSFYIYIYFFSSPTALSATAEGILTHFFIWETLSFYRHTPALVLWIYLLAIPLIADYYCPSPFLDNINYHTITSSLDSGAVVSPPSRLKWIVTQALFWCSSANLVWWWTPAYLPCQL